MGMGMGSMAAYGLKLSIPAPPFCMPAYGHYPNLWGTKFPNSNAKFRSYQFGHSITAGKSNA
eukprot:3126436-Karenia_brevis.AAC.1